jgi:hypothetical protein
MSAPAAPGASTGDLLIEALADVTVMAHDAQWACDLLGEAVDNGRRGAVHPKPARPSDADLHEVLADEAATESQLHAFLLGMITVLGRAIVGVNALRASSWAERMAALAATFEALGRIAGLNAQLWESSSLDGLALVSLEPDGPVMTPLPTELAKINAARATASESVARNLRGAFTTGPGRP